MTEYNLTQKEAAEMAGISPRQLRKYDLPRRGGMYNQKDIKYFNKARKQVREYNQKVNDYEKVVAYYKDKKKKKRENIHDRQSYPSE